MNDKDFYKNFFKNYGILSAIIVTVFVVLFYSVHLSRKSWNENLKKSVESVLNENSPGEWKVGDYIPLKNNLSTNAAAYKIKNNRNSESAFAVIVRTATFYGPLPAVYICNSKNNVSFVGFSSIHGSVQHQLMLNSSDKRIKYWQQKIPLLISQGAK